MAKMSQYPAWHYFTAAALALFLGGAAMSVGSYPLAYLLWLATLLAGGYGFSRLGKARRNP